jgi:hypothetical protein
MNRPFEERKYCKRFSKVATYRLVAVMYWSFVAISNVTYVLVVCAYSFRFKYMGLVSKMDRHITLLVRMLHE